MLVLGPCFLVVRILLNTRLLSSFKVKYISYTMAAQDLPEIYIHLSYGITITYIAYRIDFCNFDLLSLFLALDFINPKRTL